MKKNLYLLIGFLLLFSTSHAQQSRSEVGKPIVIKPCYFDISPPFRDMLQDANVKTDMSWKDGIVRNHGYPKELAPKNDLDAIKSDPNVQTSFSALNPGSTDQSFDGVGSNNGVCPPDPCGDVGPNHYMQVVNLQYAIYNKTGAKLVGPFNTSQIWNGMSNNSNDGDGVILYDEQANRWLISQFSLPNYPNGPFFEMVAISQTPDPTGSWYRYQFSFTEMPDYPKLGVWRDAYLIAVNRFNTSGNFQGPGAGAMDRTKMLAGDPSASMIYFPISNGGYYHGLPSDCDGTFPPAGTPGYFCWTSTSKMYFYDFHADFTTPANSTFTQSAALNIIPFSYMPYGTGIAQSGTSVKLDPLSYPGAIMNRLQFRKFNDHWSMVTNSTVNAGSNIAGIRWYEFRRNVTDPWSIYQQSTYAPADGNSRWCGSIAMDSVGDIALAYSTSGSSMYPSLRFAARMSSDPLNTFSVSETDLMAGGGSQTNTWSGSPSRWGDYSSLNIDPSVGQMFWYTNEYYSTTSQSNWKTRVVSFSLAEFMNVSATATPSTICTGGSTTLGATATGGSGTYTYAWTSIPAGFTSTQQNPTASPTVNTNYIVAVSDGANSKTDTVLVTVNQEPTANAGPDATYPNTTPLFSVSGSATSYSHTKWLTSGDGHFNSDTVLTTLYFTGPTDKNNGFVDITLRAYPVGTCTDSASDVAHITLTFPTGIGNTASGAFGVTLTPNPSSGNFTLVVHGVRNSEARISISDLTGKEIYRDNIMDATSEISREINLTGHPKGIYFVKVSTDQQSTTKKLVLQ